MDPQSDRVHSNTIPTIILFVGVLGTSSGAILVRLAQAGGVPSLWISAMRMLLATVLLTPLIGFRHMPALLKLPGRVWSACLLAGLFLAVHFATWIQSLEYTSIASSVVLVSTTPIWVSLYSGLTGRERVDGRVIAGLLLAVAGGVIVTLSEVCTVTAGGLVCQMQGSRPLLGNLLALCGGVMAAGYLLIGKRIQPQVETTVYIFLVYGFAGLFLLAACLVSSQPASAIQGQNWLWLLGLAVIPQLIGHTSYNWSLKHFQATYVSIAMQAEPIGSTLLGVVLFAEIPGPVKLIGGVVILAGILIVSLRKR